MVGKIALNKKSRFDRSHTANAHYENQNRVLMLPGNKRKSILACPNASKKVHINMPPSMILAFAVKLSERKKKTTDAALPPPPPLPARVMGRRKSRGPSLRVNHGPRVCQVNLFPCAKDENPGYLKLFQILSPFSSTIIQD